MTNKFLTELNSLGYTQEEALTKLKELKESEGTEEEELEAPEEPETPEEPEGTEEEEKPEKTLDIDISKLTADITKNVSETVSKSVSAEIKKQIGLLRGKPPKGKETDTYVVDQSISKNLFEKIV